MPESESAERRSRRSLPWWVVVSLQVILAVGLLLSLWARQWMDGFLTAFILVLTMVPTMLERRYKVDIPAAFEVLAIVFIFLSLFLGSVRGYYYRYWWWDVVLHSGSALLLGVLGFLLVHIMNEHERVEMHMKPAFVALFAFAFAVAVGAVWEIFEFAMDRFFGLDMQKSGLVDTMWDLIMDTAGAAVIAVLGYLYLKVGREAFFTGWIRSFVESNPHLFGRGESDDRTED